MHNAPFRLLRTVSVGATVLGLAAGAHLLAGGTLPAPGIMAALLALHVLCSTVATHFRLTLPAMVALLGSSQVVLHQAFETLSHSATAGPGAAGVHQHTMSAEASTAALLAAVNTVSTPGMEHMGHAGAMSGWMWAAHIAATLTAAALLTYGENALWSLANWLRPLYRRAAVVHVPPAQSARPSVIPRPLPRLPWRNLRPDTRRGPPSLAAVFA